MSISRGFLQGYCDRVSHFQECFGRWLSWLILVMTLLITYDVAMRYGLRSGSVALQEVEWHLFAELFLLGSAYTLQQQGHVRVDLLTRSRWVSARLRLWLDLFGHLFFLAPFCLLILLTSLPFVASSLHFHEASPDAGGLCCRYLLKSMISLGSLLLLLQGLAEAVRCGLQLFPARNTHTEA